MNAQIWWLFLIFLAFLGACIGSFLNVLITRIPQGQGIWLRRSHCLSCQKALPIVHLIPLVSYICLQGRCGFCKEKIGSFHVWVELIAAVGTPLLFAAFVPLGAGVWAILSVPFLTSLWIFYSGLALSVIDIQHRILPDRITLKGIPLGLCFAFFHPGVGIKAGLIGATVGAFGLFVFAWIYQKLRKKEGMGMGDAKYLGFIGAALGWKGVLAALWLGSVSGSIIGIIYGIAQKKGLGFTLPFGPFLAVGALIYAVSFAFIH